MKAELHWYVAQVMTGSEQETARKLTDAGMEAIAPVQILHERRHGKWWPIRRVVFPSYVFVRTGMTPRFYYFISGLPRVIRLLGADGPEPVPDEQMEVVRLFAPDGRDFGMSQGERIDGKTVITSGPLLGLEGKIVKVNARGRRATVSVPILGDTHQVDVASLWRRPRPKTTRTETRRKTRADPSPCSRSGDITEKATPP